VDSGSTDATLSIASRFPVKVLTIRPEAFSFGRSLNIGCQAAAGEFIVVASAHVYPVYRDWLEHLLSPFSDPQTGLVYGKQRGDKSTQYAERRVFVQWYPDESRHRQDHPFCNNANAAIRRALWSELPYDEGLTGLEDLDWAKRAMALGYHLAYAAEAEVVHIHEETPRQTYNRYRREAIAFKRIFPEERFRLLDLARLWLANTYSDYRHALRDGVLARELWAIPRFRLMQFTGTYRGYRQHKPVSQQLRRTFYYPNHRHATPSDPASDRTEARIRYEAVE
jgi:glycosyltransferase involved in cell wall biosynthesis